MEDTTKPMVRAHELARSGRFSKMDELIRALKAERFDHVEGHLTGPRTRIALMKLMTAARARGSEA